MPVFLRNVFAFVLAILAGLVVFLHFRSAFTGLSNALARDWKVIGGRVSTTAQNNAYIVSVQETPHIEQPRLPDISGFTVDAVDAAAPPFRKGRAIVRDMQGSPDFRKFLSLNGGLQMHRLAQGEVSPQALVIEAGDYDLEHLQAENPDAIVKTGGTYTLRLSLLVSRGASLTLRGADLRLSQEGAAFIANSGRLFIVKSKITGWSEAGNEPAPFVKKRSFRPFITTWSGARLYAGGSTFSNLGYLKGKSYGLTFSTCRFCLEADATLPRPAGALVGNTFTRMYYGFYSYEAENVAIVGNTYADNIVYGIDPHDRSRRLIIARNDVYGSGKLHGIILSREVNDSWVFSNNSHDNAGSGIVLDRNCTGNVVEGNTAARNGRDGITFFESSGNVTWGNKAVRNASSGIRVRNSGDIGLARDTVSDNGGVPVVVYSADLKETEPDRDLVLDPYARRAEAVIDGATVRARDGKPALKIDGIESLSVRGLNIVSPGPVFAGGLFHDETDISGGIDDPGILVTRKTFLLSLFQRLKGLFQ